MKNSNTTSINWARYFQRASAALLCFASLSAWATLTSVVPTSTSITVATGGTYSFSVTGSVGEPVSSQSRFCFDLQGVTPPANGIIFPAAGGCNSSSVIPFNPVVAAGPVYSFSGNISAAQASIMVAESAALGQPAGARFVLWRQGFGTSGFAIVRINLIEPVVGPQLPPSLTPNSLNFGNVTVGTASAPQVMTLTNPGPGPITLTGAFATAPFTFNSNCANTLLANASCQFTTIFSPTAAQPYSGLLTINTTGGSVSGGLSGNGVAAATTTPPTLTPGALGFGNVTVGQTSPPQTRTFSSNTSSTAPTLSISHPPWINATTTCPNSLTANLTCQITAACAPSAPGPLSSTISVTAGSIFVSSNVFCTGVTTLPLTLTPSGASFGSVAVGTSSPPQVFTLGNPNTTTVSLVSTDVSPGFTYTSTCGTQLAGNSTCQLAVVFAPTLAQAYSGALTIVASNGSISRGFTGIGTAASVLAPTLAPASANFGTATVGTSAAPQVFTLNNPTSSAIPLISATASPGFTFTSACGGQVAANSSCQFTVTFTPTAVQAYSGLFTVVTSPTTLSSALSGSGTLAPPSASPSLAPVTFNFGAVTVGATPASAVFTLNNPTASALTPLTINVGVGFTQTSTCGASLAASASCLITVRFAPAAAQAYSGALTVLSGSVNLTSSVSGIGTAAPIVPGVTAPSSLTDVSPKRAVGNVGSDLAQTLSYTFTGNSAAVIPGDGIFCFDLIGVLPAGATVTGNPCASGSEFARHPTVASAFQYTRVGAFVRGVRETIRVPSAVSRFARENNRARYYFVRNFLPNQYAVVAIELLGNVANQPIALTDMRMYFKQGGEQPIVFVKRGSALPPIEAKINFTGSGWLRGAWEIVQPGDVEPTESDLITDASLPLEQRGLQRRYTVVGSFQQYFAAVGQATLTPPNLSRFPVTVDGGYRVLLRIFADPAIGAEGDARLASGSAGFSLPTTRYFVGSFASHGAKSSLPPMTINRPAPDHTFTAIEPVSFGWQASADAAVYLLEAVDVTGRVVAAAQVPASAVELNAAYTAPQPWRTQAARGATRWRVTAYGRDGEPLARSDWRGVQF